MDLAKIDGFMLDTARLLGSELVAISTGDEFKAAVLLWARAWQQKPHCSLPDDDRVLASFAMVPRAKWAKIRNVAMRGFVLCSDGRWYHRVLAEDAKRANVAVQRRRAAKAKWENGEIVPDNREKRSQRLAAARVKGTHTAEEWSAMLSVFSHRCVKCGAAGKIVKDHITPIYQGGSDGIDNLQPMCVSCNYAKGPNATDHRDDACTGWLDRLQKCLQNACKMPAKCLQNACKMPPIDGTGRERDESKKEKEAASPPARDPRFGMVYQGLERILDHSAFDGSRIHAWLAAGADPELDIFPAVRRVHKRNGPGPPKPLKYFDGAIADALASRTQALPPGTASTPRTAASNRHEAVRQACAAFDAYAAGNASENQRDRAGDTTALPASPGDR